MNYDVILLSGADRKFYSSSLGSFVEGYNFFRSLGIVRLRTHLSNHNITTRAVDFCDFYDEQTLEKILDCLISKQTKLIGLSTVYLDVKFWDKFKCVFLKFKTKFPNLKIIIGGQSAFLSEKSDYIDFSISGYAEQAIMAYINQENLKTQNYNSVDSNVDYPYTSNNLYNHWTEEDCVSPYEALPIEASRGCIFSCAFCNFPMKGKKKFDYIRSYDNLQKELVRNFDMFGVTNYVFVDDTFNDSLYKIQEIHKLFSNLPFKVRYTAYIKPELLVTFPEQIDLLVDSGLLSAIYGIESFNHKTRMSIKKMGDVNKVLEKIEEIKCKGNKNTIFNGFAMIAGLPYESEENLINSHEYIMSNDYIDGVFWNALSIFNKKMVPKRKLSPIDLEPEKYGYKVRNISSSVMYWQNEHTNFKRATNIANRFQIESTMKKGIHSFSVPNVQNLGFDIFDIDVVDSLKYANFNTRQEKLINSIISNTVDRYINSILYKSP